jgi:hypothetical protein
MTKQEMMTAIKECARKLGHAPSQTELAKMVNVSPRGIQKHFGKYSWALRACNLERTSGQRLELDALFRDWGAVARKLKKVPSALEYTHLARYSETPLRKRFGSWVQVAQSFKDYAEKHGWTEEWRDVLETIAAQETKRGDAEEPDDGTEWPKILPDRPVYGAVMHECTLAHGPTNEMGVVYLFGALSARLGFVVMRIQPEFPDCEAMRQVGKNRWQWVRIEFEHESRNFLKHMHPVKGCDLIVCWKHNWPECPLEVVELSRAMRIG